MTSRSRFPAPATVAEAQRVREKFREVMRTTDDMEDVVMAHWHELKKLVPRSRSSLTLYPNPEQFANLKNLLEDHLFLYIDELQQESLLETKETPSEVAERREEMWQDAASDLHNLYQYHDILEELYTIYDKNRKKDERKRRARSRSRSRLRSPTSAPREEEGKGGGSIKTKKRKRSRSRSRSRTSGETKEEKQKRPRIVKGKETKR